MSGADAIFGPGDNSNDGGNVYARFATEIVDGALRRGNIQSMNRENLQMSLN